MRRKRWTTLVLTVASDCRCPQQKTMFLFMERTIFVLSIAMVV